MSNLQWTCIVVLSFVLATLLFWRRARKDMKGAILAALAVILAGALLIVVSGCTVSREYRPWLEAGVAWDREHNVGSNPGCVVRVRQPIVPGRLVAGYEHHSSCGDQHDRNEINQFEVMAVIPLGREK